MKPQKIAIIGGGPSGLTALKSALDDGLEAILFEQSVHIGGQWYQHNDYSGVWESLHTNTSYPVTVFSDFPHRAAVGLYPSHREVLQYLEDYKNHFHLAEYIRLNIRVEYIDRLQDGNYTIRSSAKGVTREEVFSHVIIASGRFNKPHLPDLPGLDRFQVRKLHAMAYKRNSDFSGRRVLVVGNSISGLEIASDLSMEKSVTVITSSRKPRYIPKKMLDGKPNDHTFFTRYRALAAQAYSPAVNAEKFRQFIIGTWGNPADFGGLRPSENLLEAGIASCQDYLDQVQKKRITPKGPVSAFTTKGVVFADGTEAEIDDIIFATGYDLNLPFLSDKLYTVINTGDQHLDLFKYTFHPDLPNMAFIGLYMQIGPKFVSFELQARWIAGCWSNNIPLPGRQEMLTSIEAFRRSKKLKAAEMAQEMILLFARAAGFEPALHEFPELAGSLLFGPLAPSQFRLQGHGKKENAKENYLAGNGGSINKLNELGARQLEELKALARVLKDYTSLQKLIKYIDDK